MVKVSKKYHVRRKGPGKRKLRRNPKTIFAMKHDVSGRYVFGERYLRKLLREDKASEQGEKDIKAELERRKRIK